MTERSSPEIDAVMEPLPAPTTRDPQALHELVRRFAVSEQRGQARIFHSIRAAAQHFGVPNSTIARIYRRLSEDGILRTVRGAGTVLEGAGAVRTLHVSGVVGLPVFLPRFLSWQEYRTVLLRLRRELRARRFAADLVFYDAPSAQGLLTLAPRLKRRGFDSVVWLDVDRAARDVVAGLHDGGMRVVAISRSSRLNGVPCRYRICRDRGVRTVFQDWRAAGVRSAVLIAIDGNAGAAERTIRQAADDNGLQLGVVGPADQERLAAFVDAIDEAVIFPANAAEVCALRAPEALARLMQRRRVLLMTGVPSFVCSEVPDVSADLVSLDGQLLAEAITADLLSGDAFAGTRTSIFEATAQLRAPLRAYAPRL
jgi:hypothetical protein